MQPLCSSVCLAEQYPGDLSVLQTAESEDERRAAALPRILVVDDERLLADTTAAILKRSGFAARTAYDAFEALEMMTSFRPDYVLSDIMMPAMNGIDLAIAITKIYPTAKVLLFSGQAGISQLLEESRAKGFDFPLLAKPVHPLKLVEEIKRLDKILPH